MRPGTDIESDLARLADGTLDPERAQEVEAQVANSPELAAQLAEQRRALTAMRALDDSAPMALREQVQRMHERAAPKRRRARRYGVAGAFTTAAACVAVALAVIVGAGASSPTLAQAAALTVKPATGPAPGHTWDGTLNLDVDGVPYPYWKHEYGWVATGSRVDKIDGRTATTVFYRKGNQRIGYTIVAGKPVSVSGSPRVSWVDGTRFRRIPVKGNAVVTWERRGHSCILSGQGVTWQQLLKLASWRDDGNLPYSSS